MCRVSHRATIRSFTMRMICCFIFIGCIACSTKESAPVTTHVVEAPAPIVVAPMVTPVMDATPLDAEMSLDATPAK